MNKQFGNDDPLLAAYVARVYAPEDEVLSEIRQRSTREGLPDIQVAALDGRHLEVLTRALAARQAVEIGTLGGYSGVCILRGMVDGGLLHTIEMEPRHAEVARESFRRAGFAGRAQVHVGVALEVLPGLAREGPFDLCFIDADKESYPQYLGWAAAHLRRGGAVVADNAFLFGHLAGGRSPSDARDASLQAMLAFHETLANGGAFRSTVVPTGEGLALGIKL